MLLIPPCLATQPSCLRERPEDQEMQRRGPLCSCPHPHQDATGRPGRRDRPASHLEPATATARARSRCRPLPHTRRRITTPPLLLRLKTFCCRDALYRAAATSRFRFRPAEAAAAAPARTRLHPLPPFHSLVRPSQPSLSVLLSNRPPTVSVSQSPRIFGQSVSLLDPPAHPSVRTSRPFVCQPSTPFVRQPYILRPPVRLFVDRPSVRPSTVRPLTVRQSVPRPSVLRPFVSPSLDRPSVDRPSVCQPFFPFLSV